MTCRVNGNLNLSRAIGDLKYKGNDQLAPAEQIITAQPDIVKVHTQPHAKCIMPCRLKVCRAARHHLSIFVGHRYRSSASWSAWLQVELRPEDRFFVLACDGVWDVMSNQDVVQFVNAYLDTGMALPDIASQLLDACLAPDPRETRGIGMDS